MGSFKVEEKLTIRIAEDDLLYIDEFLERQPQFGSRSEFIRKVVFDFIENSDKLSTTLTADNVKLSPSMEDTITKAVERGLFVDHMDAVNTLIREAEKRRLLLDLIQERSDNKKAEEDIFSDFDRNVRPYRSRSPGNQRVIGRRE